MARRAVDFGVHGVADGQAARGERAVLAKNRRLNFLRVFDGKNALRRLNRAVIADLAAGLGVKRRRVEHDDARVAFV